MARTRERMLGALGTMEPETVAPIDQADAQPALTEQIDPRDAVIAELRLKLQALQEQRQQPAPAIGLRKPGLYRVALQGARSRKSSITVEPHEKRDHYDTAKRGKESASYDALELFLSNHERDVQKTAWLRYCEANDLDPKKDRPFFKVRSEAGATVDHLDIPAVSAADAEATFKRYNGIGTTAAEFTTVLLDEERVVPDEE